MKRRKQPSTDTTNLRLSCPPEGERTKNNHDSNNKWFTEWRAIRRKIRNASNQQNTCQQWHQTGPNKWKYLGILTKPTPPSNKLKLMTNFEKQLYMSKDGWLLIQTLINKVIKGSKPFDNVVEQCCVILQRPEDAQGIMEAYKQIKQGNRSIQEYILEMQSGYYDIQVPLSYRQAIEIARWSGKHSLWRSNQTRFKFRTNTRLHVCNGRNKPLHKKLWQANGTIYDTTCSNQNTIDRPSQTKKPDTREFNEEDFKIEQKWHVNMLQEHKEPMKH